MARDPAEFEGVQQELVLEVLRKHGVDVFETEGTVYLSKDDIHKAFVLPRRGASQDAAPVKQNFQYSDSPALSS